MSSVTDAIDELAVANRIIANEGVVDAYGHVSRRHPERPDRFLLSRSLSPSLVEPRDIMEFGQDGRPNDGDERHPYIERFIHGSIYAARPDVTAIVHSHAIEILPYTVSTTPLRPVINTAGIIGAHLPIWDIATRFGDDTNLLVVNAQHGDDLAAALGANHVILMRGHGFTATGGSLIEAIRRSIYLKVNAAVLSEALPLGGVRYLSDGEISATEGVDPNAPELRRAWDYWAARAGCRQGGWS